MGIFRFKQFQIDDTLCGMKIGTDGVLLGAWAEVGECHDMTQGQPHHIIDVGCGSGLIALMMAQRCPTAIVTAVEIDTEAAATARANAMSSPWARRVNIMQGDVLDWHPTDDCAGGLTIVSNPPFFIENLHSPSGARALARHGEGLNVESLIAWSAGVMRPGRCDSLSFIAPAERDGDIRFALSMGRLALSRVTTVVPRPGRQQLRCLYEARPERDVTGPYRASTLYLRDDHGQLSDEYKALTHDFYIQL